MTCPKCRRVQYFCCSNKKCFCWKTVPKGKKPQRFNKDGETISCPYCGFKAHGDYWETRDMEAAMTPKEGQEAPRRAKAGQTGPSEGKEAGSP
jgi:uncharacterized Zn finger protein (UPF0148 family)